MTGRSNLEDWCREPVAGANRRRVQAKITPEFPPEPGYSKEERLVAVIPPESGSQASWVVPRVQTTRPEKGRFFLHVNFFWRCCR